MTLKNWLENRWISEHTSSADEVNNQLRKIDRDLKTAKIKEMDADWKLNIAFNAARLCADLALRASGYRMKVSAGAHEKTLESLRYTMDEDSDVVTLLRALLNKRGAATYDGSGAVTDKEASEAIEIAEEIAQKLHNWLKREHPGLLPGS